MMWRKIVTGENSEDMNLAVTPSNLMMAQGAAPL
jgi:hypothetical protein